VVFIGSRFTIHAMSSFQIVPLRAFADNYVWTLRDERCAAVVDPGDAQPVLDYLEREKLELTAILNTHHHADHVGCGRLFEGTPRQMFESLSRLTALPDDTRVYRGLEYTLSNIRFAKAADPANRALEALEVKGANSIRFT